jgi:hypothetical protein
MAYLQYEKGALDQDRLNSVLAILCLVLSSPIGPIRWENAKRNF